MDYQQSAAAATLTGRISRKNIQIQGEKYYDATTNIVAAADSAGFGGLEVVGLVLEKIFSLPPEQTASSQWLPILEIHTQLLL